VLNTDLIGCKPRSSQ